MSLPEFGVRKPVTNLMIFSGIIVIALYSLGHLGVDRPAVGVGREQLAQPPTPAQVGESGDHAPLPDLLGHGDLALHRLPVHEHLPRGRPFEPGDNV